LAFRCVAAQFNLQGRYKLDFRQALQVSRPGPRERLRQFRNVAFSGSLTSWNTTVLPEFPSASLIAIREKVDGQRLPIACHHQGLAAVAKQILGHSEIHFGSTPAGCRCLPRPAMPVCAARAAPPGLPNCSECGAGDSALNQ